MSADGYWFTSSRFEIEPGEGHDINPGIYGRQLAIWLKERLGEHGYAVEEIIEEDWGQCLVCSRDPFLLWVGCENVRGGAADLEPGGKPPAKETIVWHCFAAIEISLWKKLFRKIDAAPARAELDRVLGEILAAEPRITRVEEP